MVQMLSTFLFVSFMHSADEPSDRRTANEESLFRTIIMIVLKIMMGFHNEIICYLITAPGKNAKRRRFSTETNYDLRMNETLISFIDLNFGCKCLNFIAYYLVLVRFFVEMHGFV